MVLLYKSSSLLLQLSGAQPWTLTSESLSSWWTTTTDSFVSDRSSWACAYADLWMWDLISHAHPETPVAPSFRTRTKSLKRRYIEITTKVKKAEAKNATRRMEARMAAEQHRLMDHCTCKEKISLQRHKMTATEAMNATTRPMRVKDTIVKGTMPLNLAKA